MRRGLIFCAAIASAVLWRGHDAFACQIDSPDYPHLLATSDLVFEGRVARIEALPFAASIETTWLRQLLWDELLEVDYEVLRVWKGTPGKRVTVEWYVGFCASASAQMNTTVMVFVREKPRYRWLRHGSGATVSYVESQVPKLGPGRPPHP